MKTTLANLPARPALVRCEYPYGLGFSTYGFANGLIALAWNAGVPVCGLRLDRVAGQTREFVNLSTGRYVGRVTCPAA